MVITNLQEKENKKFFVPIRPGNRGGWSLFKWDTVRQMPYKDREMYLGNSAVIGVLDKGGKWRKKDWYLKTDRKNGGGQKQQMSQAIRRDKQRINKALGLQSQSDDQDKLTETQMKQLLKKIKNKGEGEYQEPTQDKMIGLGFDKTKVQIRAKPGISQYDPLRLQGNQSQVQKQVSKEEKKDKKKDKEKKKKDKKDKKHKKDKSKHKQHRHQRSRSRQHHKKQKKRIESDSQQ